MDAEVSTQPAAIMEARGDLHPPLKDAPQEVVASSQDEQQEDGAGALSRAISEHFSMHPSSIVCSMTLSIVFPWCSRDAVT